MHARLYHLGIGDELLFSIGKMMMTYQRRNERKEKKNLNCISYHGTEQTILVVVKVATAFKHRCTSSFFAVAAMLGICRQFIAQRSGGGVELPLEVEHLLKIGSANLLRACGVIGVNQHDGLGGKVVCANKCSKGAQGG